MIRPVNKIALVFDFDGTVSPNVMLSLIFESEGINEYDFWSYTSELADQGYDRELSYLKALCDFCSQKGIKLTNNRLREIGFKLQFYPGFPEIIDRLKLIAHNRGFTLETYVITAGLQEMVDGSRLGPYLTRCWGCRYAENDEGTISFPMQVVTSANKVEKLYLIKRQLLEHKDEYQVNLVEPRNDLIPWNNLVYLADGATDVPAFEVVRRGGGLTIALYDVDVGNIARNMIVGRTHLFAAADYREGSYLDLVLTAAVKNAERV